VTLYLDIFTAWTKFRSPPEGVRVVEQTLAHPKWPSQSEIFELLNIDCQNSQCRKLFLRQLFGPNLAVFQETKFGVPLGEQTPALPPNGPPIVKFLNCST